MRVLVADDQDLFRGGFAMILNAHEDISVVGEAADGAEAIAKAVELAPDLVLMDIRMPNVDGVAATAEISPAHVGEGAGPDHVRRRRPRL